MKAKGKLTLNTTPWTRVSLGKTVLGDTPLIEVPVPAGKQVLKLVNEAEGVSQTIEVQIKPGQTTVKKLSF
jgi:serine/threonine-protein kinase